MELSIARQLDENDPIRKFRKHFRIPLADGKEQVYFLGNSLGLQPVTTAGHLEQVLEAWARYGVEGFFMGEQPWLDYHASLRQPLSRIVGALPEEVVAMNQLTVNLHLLLVSFYRPAGKRNRILCEAKAFPSDQYMLETHVRHHGLDPDAVILEVAPRPGEHCIRPEDILETIDRHKDELALVLWGGVNYYTGQLFDMKTITEAARRAGAKVGFDLAHAAGNVPLQLHDWGVDFAAWCSYKYLNSGPGGIGNAYIHAQYHRDPALHRFAGWWGYDKATRFQMKKGFVPASSAEGWQLSTPSPLLYAAHKAALEIFDEAGWEAIQQKRKQLNDYLWSLLGSLKERPGVRLVEWITPLSGSERGCQVSMLMRKDGKRIFDALTKAGFFLDWREPDVIRLAPVPLYNTYEEVWKFVHTLQAILESDTQNDQAQV